MPVFIMLLDLLLRAVDPRVDTRVDAFLYILEPMDERCLLTMHLSYLRCTCRGSCAIHSGLGGSCIITYINNEQP